MLAESKIYAILPVKDMARAKEFYRDKLGLEPSQETPGGVMYEGADGTGFSLYETENAGTAANTAMCWLVDDLDGTIEELKAKGIVFEVYDMPGVDPATGVATMEGLRAVWFKDSESNILCVSEMM
jgi:catechol 2,3-dioxygenase-like lactoylglutathione lyase family enzyme